MESHRVKDTILLFRYKTKENASPETLARTQVGFCNERSGGDNPMKERE